jgi:hypothetical protein
MYWQMAAHEHTQHTGKVFFPHLTGSLIDLYSISACADGCIFQFISSRKGGEMINYCKTGTLIT